MSGPENDDVLAEIRHELGNRFQRLYFWAGQADGGRDGAQDPASKLGEELAGLEHYLGSVLEYFAEPRLETVEVSVADLAARVRSALPEREIEVEGLEKFATATASVDAGSVSRALELVARRVDAAAAAGPKLSLLVRQGAAPRSVALELSGQPDGDRALQLLDGIEAMVARRCLALHGGSLEEGGRPPSIVVTLPVG